MKELNGIFADNLIFLRKKTDLTQLELAEKLNYSDKAVSKWERGESMPDVAVLVAIAEIFGVSVDYLITEHAEDEKVELSDDKKQRRGLIVSLITFFALLAAEIIVFLGLFGFVNSRNVFLFCFVYPLPIWAIIGIVFSTVWGSKFARFVAVSILLVFLTLDAFLIVELATGVFYYLIFAVLIPALGIVYFSFYLSGNFFKRKNR